jgi:hypothetical protein
VVHNERIDELLPLEERIRRLGGERSFAFGIAIGGALQRLVRGLSARANAAALEAPSLGGAVAGD